MLCDDLLVAPVLSDSGDVSSSVPEGTWTRLLTGGTVQGPRWVRDRCDFLTAPVLVRPNTVLPVGAVDDRPDYDYAEGVTLRLYQLADGDHVTVVGDSTFRTHRDGDRIRVEVEGAPSRWRLLLVGAEAVDGADGGDVTPHPDGVLVDVEGDALTVRGIR